jgi:uncharacterized protein
MTEAYRVVDHEEVDLSEALLVLGFPTVGFVGTIAATYLVETCAMGHVASVVSPRLPPVAVVRDGQALSPVRVYLTDMVCGMDGECSQLAVVQSDAAPPPEDVAALVETLVAWTADRGGRRFVCLEGMPSRGSPAEAPKVYGVGSTMAVVSTLEALGVEPLLEGTLTGVGGVALYVARSRGVDGLCLLAETVPEFPDARAAAKLVETLGPLLPELKLDARPLYERAEALERYYRDQMARQKEDASHIAERSRMMYG